MDRVKNRSTKKYPITIGIKSNLRRLKPIGANTNNHIAYNHSTSISLDHLSKIKQSKIKNKKTTILIQSIKDELLPWAHSRNFFKGCKSIFINNGNHGLEDLSNLEYLACI